MEVKCKHIYWFSHHNLSSPCTRYRGKYLLEDIQKSIGTTYQFAFPSYQLKPLLNFIKAYFGALLFRKKNSIIVFQKTYTLGIYSTLLKTLLLIRNNNTIYDFDDADYIKFPPKTIHFFINNSKTCITGSSSLTKYAQGLSKNSAKVYTLSSPILKQYSFTDKVNDTFTIGWVGFYNYHRKSLLKILFPALTQIDFDFRLTLLGVIKAEHFDEISTYFINKSNIEIVMPRNFNWHDETKLYNLIKEFDIGVSPLIDNEINRAKSAFKLKQYLCCGVPVVGSYTGENSKIIKNGENGFIASSPDDFRQKILELKNMDKAQKLILKANAIKSVKNYEMENYSQSFMQIVTKSLT